MYNPKLSYEKIIHNKVYEKINYFLLKPEGKKKFLWFTHFNNQFLAITIEINKYNILNNLNIITTSFDEKLAYDNSLFIGYEFKITDKPNSFFTITDIINYNNLDENFSKFGRKLILLENLFSNFINQQYILNNSTILGLPTILKNLKNIEFEKENIIYNLAGILYIKENLYYPFGISYYNITKKLYAIFKIQATIENDIYNMYTKDKFGTIIFYDILLINSFKNSKLLNNIFRFIKENNNLDLLEESDSDSEFENTNQNKFVNLKKQINFKCQYVHKFKKWIPIEISKEEITPYKDVKNLF